MFNVLSRGAFARAAFVAAIGVAFLLAALGPRSARADEAPAAPACETTYDHVVEIGHDVVAENPDATFTDYTAAEAKKLIDAMNAVEPVSTWTAEHIIVIDPADGEAFRVGIVDKGCMTHAFPVPREIWLGLVRDALGQQS